MTAPDTAVSRSAFHYRNFTIYWISRIAGAFATQILAVAIAWQVYDLTRDPFDLGLIGLVQFLPSVLLVLVTGTIADHFNRRWIMAICMGIEAACAGVLFFFALTGLPALWIVYALLAVFGVARAFFGPASSSIVVSLVPPQALSNAITMSSSAWQLAAIAGPVAGGLLYGLSAPVAYMSALVLFAVAAITIPLLSLPKLIRSDEPQGWGLVVAGFRFVWSEKVVFGAISLDLFAVLLGGATALLPAVARDVLHAGPWGLGMLRAAPGIGALAMAAWLSIRPIRDHAGIIMFSGVTLFGLATVVFGLSTTGWISIASLLVMGASDMVSVAVRETLIQLWTPDAVRGRVNAVNGVFIGASNELGEFRAGMSASLFGVLPAIVIGGIGTVLVALLWARGFPQLRQARHLDTPARA
ncbi:MFS transporter [Radicibacter daui]|uniref:MFS transporter n=1 Tax=Radicibacter daui TaxID=3064829 RepID=UPI004046AD01